MEPNSSDTPRASPETGAEAGSGDAGVKTSPDSAIQSPQEGNHAVAEAPEISQTLPGEPEGNGGKDSPQTPEPGPVQAGVEKTTIPTYAQLGIFPPDGLPNNGGNGNGGGKRPPTQAQVEASRCNSKLSLGPRTPEGKARVRHNAVKHGIFSDEVLITRGEGKEDREQYEDLYRRLMERLHPRDILEELEVKRIIGATWRQGRLLRFERGAIRMQADAFTCREQTLQAKEYEDEYMATLKGKKIDLYNDPNSIKIGIRHLLDIRHELETENINEYYMFEILGMFPWSQKFPTQFWELFGIFTRAKEGENAQHEGEAGSESERAKAELLRFLDAVIQGMKELLPKFEERDRLERKAKFEMVWVPNEKIVNLIIRYWGHLERIIFRSMANLERLQARNGNTSSNSGNGGGQENPQIANRIREMRKLLVQL